MMHSRRGHVRGRTHGLTLVEVVVAVGLLVVGLLALVGALQSAGGFSKEAELRAQQQLLADSVLQQARGLELTGPGGLYALCGTTGRVINGNEIFPGFPANPYPGGLVAVVRCEDPGVNVAYNVDLNSAGLAGAFVQLVRVHVQALVVANPTQTNPALLVPVVGPDVPPVYDLVAYRIAS
jgi:type II secretory pathway pseudopilin PulG